MICLKNYKYMSTCSLKFFLFPIPRKSGESGLRSSPFSFRDRLEFDVSSRRSDFPIGRSLLKARDDLINIRTNYEYRSPPKELRSLDRTIRDRDAHGPGDVAPARIRRTSDQRWTASLAGGDGASRGKTFVSPRREINLSRTRSRFATTRNRNRVERLRHA